MPTNDTRGLWRGKRNNKNSTKYGEWYQGIDVMHKTVTVCIYGENAEKTLKLRQSILCDKELH